MIAKILSVAVLWLFSHLVLACDFPEGETLNNSGITLHYQLQPAVIKLGEAFTIQACLMKNQQPLTEIQQVKFDATMPAHGHGMNYYPEIKQQENGIYTIEGLLLHMPGQWQFDFTVRVNKQRLRFIADYIL